MFEHVLDNYNITFIMKVRSLLTKHDEMRLQQRPTVLHGRSTVITRCVACCRPMTTALSTCRRWSLICGRHASALIAAGSGRTWAGW